ncbi:flagellar hook-basal body protein [Alicyclobacillus sp. SO9]|uniref:flagellar hook-basal body protein n=1 Tax=Alicyclobacillus sp. SO9 TaxID=2665646 RepID=UPI0018E75D90|nr:flagellar hook-basal body protein [Alicyclobacillus sp. SO9]QQE78753.1 flagellar hook-basal body protein [Alicyclobacillus sp. SO9]
MQAIWSSLSALNASNEWMSRIGNNIANQSTPGYASQTGSFADTLTSAVSGNATAPSVASRYTPQGWNGGTGVMATSTGNNFSQMSLKQTGNPTDLAIQGSAFFQVAGHNGQTEYTKAGNFIWSRQPSGRYALSTTDGKPVLDTQGQAILQPAAPGSTMNVSSDGQVTFTTGNGQTVGGPKIALVHIANPGQSLSSAGNNTYTASAGASPRLVNGQALGNGANGQLAAGQSRIKQGSLAMSNVNLTTAMVNMLQAQHMFDLNSKAVGFSSQMMQIAATIR